MKKAIPSVITTIGLLLSLAWVFGASTLVGIVGLLCDTLDGRAARRLGVESEFGSLLDWTADVLVLAILLGRLGAWPFIALLLPLQVILRQRKIRFSGRAMATIVVMLWRVVP